jgi:hypothetical protein
MATQVIQLLDDPDNALIDFGRNPILFDQIQLNSAPARDKSPMPLFL